METCSINFFLEFLHASLNIDIFMELPMGMKVHEDLHHAPKLNNPLYGFNQSSTNRFEHLKKSLELNLSGQYFTLS